MAGKVKHLQLREGRYYARLAVPAALKAIVGKTELKSALGADRKAALKALPGAVAQILQQLASAEQQLALAIGRDARPGRYPQTIPQMARRHYQHLLDFDEEQRAKDERWASVQIDDLLVARLRAGFSGSASNAELQDLFGDQIEQCRKLGNTSAEIDTHEWRVLAQALCLAEYEALARMYERDDGVFSGVTDNPMLKAAIALAERSEAEPEPVSLLGLCNDYVKARQRVGSMKDGGKKHSGIITGLISFIGHDDARRLTKSNLIKWRDQLLEKLSTKTVGTIYLSAIRSNLKWAVEEDLLTENVAVDVRQSVGKKNRTRERGYTASEAMDVLTFSRAYFPKPDANGRIREAPKLSAAKRWVPLICAFTGARVAEITQLRKEDVRTEGDVTVLRLTPEAGTIKTGSYRDVPLHPQLIDLGFGDLVASAPDGPLFHEGKGAAAAGQQANRLAAWLRASDVVPKGVQPNHAWRHRFKTTGRELGLSDLVIDAICGHAAKTVGDDYGEVTLLAKSRVVEEYPRYLGLV